MKKIATSLFLILSVISYSGNILNKNSKLPPALVLNYSSTNPTCPGLNNGAVYATVTGGNLPLSNFTLTNGSNVVSNATGIFLNLAPGNYTLSISDVFSLTATQNIIITAPNDLTVSLPATICSGTSTNLSVSGSTTSYLWTASPTDASLTGANNTSASPTVSPTTTTTYTVTSTSNSPSSNMVFNGDFSLGNIGFTTDYTYLVNAGGGGAQGIYGVSITPNSWFRFFPLCTNVNDEHANGIGNMIIFDGSISNSGNDKAWGQTIAVQPNKTYTFSYWVRSVVEPNPANIEVKINGVVIGTDLAPSSLCDWSLRTYTWNSGTATSADIALYDKVTLGDGNDFAIDDISFTTNVICNLSKTVLITVTPSTIPIFNTVNPICAGATLAALPTSSSNSTPITGIWSPALNNLATTNYTFVPAAGQCASNASLTITVNPIVTPTFTAVNPICSGATLAALQTPSNNLITGTWSPAPNNLATTNYTFVPTAGQCASNGSMSITVNPNVTPSFTQVPAICSGATLLPLSTTSINLINGSWSPAIDNTATTNYSFTPDLGQCSSNASMTITVTPFPQFSITEGCDGSDFVLSATGIGTTNASYKWYDNLRQNIGTASSIVITNSGNYSLELSNNGCSEEKPITVTNILCAVPKGISPNGDGDNDFLDLTNLNVQNLQIFNRHGIEVFSKTNYTNEWAGKSNAGTELPDGTYYYVVYFPSGKTNTGWIYINK
ncbi:Gliding motility-associated, C-terminal domain [Flavobacteriaceae bacterium]